MIRTVDIKRAEAAMRDFLEALGQDLTDPNLIDTPKRVTKMYAEELTNGQLNGSLTTFETTNAGNQFVLVTNIEVESLCSHHLMPIRGVAHIGAFFIADADGTVKLPGLSKYARIVEAFSHHLQLQERLTNQIADAIYRAFSTDFLYVLLDCEHYCMKHRGVRLHDSETMTTQLRISEEFKQHNFNSGQFINDFYAQLNVRLMRK